jgi:low-affinity ferrous iron transport protein
MVFILAFLENIREGHTKYMTKCLEAIWKADAALELRLRTATGDKMKIRPWLSRLSSEAEFSAESSTTQISSELLLGSQF